MADLTKPTQRLTKEQWAVVIDAIAYYETVLSDDPARYRGKLACLERADIKLSAARRARTI